MAVFEKIVQTRSRDPYLVLTGAGDGTHFSLRQDIVSIGRSTANGICLNDANISKRHCLLVKTPEGVKMVDLESTNGTWINDRQIKEQVLRDGDRLRVGPYEFRFVAGAFVPPPPTVMPGEAAVGHPFGDLLVHELRRTPFWLISLGVHLALLLLLWNASFIHVPRREQPRRVTARTAASEDDDLQELEEETVEDTVPETPLIVDPDELTDPEPAAGQPSDAAVGGVDDGTLGLRGARRRGLGDERGLGLAGLGLNKHLSKPFEDYLKGMRGRGLDVAIVFDSTGSMQGIIDQVRARIGLMNTYISALIPGSYRLAMVTYRDRNDEYVTRYEPFTRDPYQTLLFIEAVNAAGGDDIPEAVLAGLDTACRKLKWRKNASKVILLFGDAPPHDQEIQACRSVAARFKRNGGVVHTIFTEVGAREDALDSADRKTVAAFRSIARYGGGTFSFLDQESRIVQSIQGLIFGKRFRKDVERLSTRIDYGWKGRYIEKKIRQRDIAFLLRHARRTPLHPLIVDGLIRIQDPRIDREMRRMARNPELPPTNRSAARYVLLRKGIARR